MKLSNCRQELPADEFRPARNRICYALADVARDDPKSLQTLSCLHEEIKKNTIFSDLRKPFGVAFEHDEPVQVSPVKGEDYRLKALDSAVSLKLGMKLLPYDAIVLLNSGGIKQPE